MSRRGGSVTVFRNYARERLPSIERGLKKCSASSPRRALFFAGETEARRHETRRYLPLSHRGRWWHARRASCGSRVAVAPCSRRDRRSLQHNPAFSYLARSLSTVMSAYGKPWAQHRAAREATRRYCTVKPSPCDARSPALSAAAGLGARPLSFGRRITS